MRGRQSGKAGKAGQAGGAGRRGRRARRVGRGGHATGGRARGGFAPIHPRAEDGSMTHADATAATTATTAPAHAEEPAEGDVQPGEVTPDPEG